MLLCYMQGHTGRRFPSFVLDKNSMTSGCWRRSVAHTSHSCQVTGLQPETLEPLQLVLATIEEFYNLPVIIIYLQLSGNIISS